MSQALAIPRFRRRILPGFGLSLGFTLTYLSLIVLIPLSAVAIKASGLGLAGFFREAFTERALHAYALSFGASLPVVKIPKYSAWAAHFSPSGTFSTADGAQVLKLSPSSFAVPYRTAASNFHRFGNTHPAA